MLRFRSYLTAAPRRGAWASVFFKAVGLAVAAFVVTLIIARYALDHAQIPGVDGGSPAQTGVLASRAGENPALSAGQKAARVPGAPLDLSAAPAAKLETQDAQSPPDDSQSAATGPWPPEPAACPQGSVTDFALLQGADCMTRNESLGGVVTSIYQGRSGPLKVMRNSLKILGGTGDFSLLASSGKSLRVRPGQRLRGVVTLLANNDLPAWAVAPLVGAYSWGEPKKSWWLINGWIPPGRRTYTSAVRLSAPTRPGRYAVVFAFSGELNGAQVASASAWGIGRLVWNDCNDIAFLSLAQLSLARRCGFTIDNWLTSGGYRPSYVALDAIFVTVARG